MMHFFLNNLYVDEIPLGLFAIMLQVTISVC
jgi:hypothetical protein